MSIKELLAEHDDYSISELCRIGKVSRAAYYKWTNHQDNGNDRLNQRIAELTESIHEEHPDMGYRRIRDTIEHDEGIRVNDMRVLRICRMKKYNP